MHGAPPVEFNATFLDEVDDAGQIVHRQSVDEGTPRGVTEARATSGFHIPDLRTLL
jgi:hypothetical protein